MLKRLERFTLCVTRPSDWPLYDWWLSEVCRSGVVSDYLRIAGRLAVVM